MSVMLIPDADLVQVAAYAARQQMLPPRVSAMAFAQGLREANVALWEERYGEVLDLEPISASALEAALRQGEALDRRRIVRAIPLLHYNCVLIEGAWIWGAVARLTRQISVDDSD